MERSSTDRAPLFYSSACERKNRRMAENPRTIKLVHITTIPVTQWVLLRGQNQYMSQRGFEVHAVASPGVHLAKLGKRDGVVTHAVNISQRISPFSDFFSLMRLFLLLWRIKPVIVQLSTPKAALLGSIAAWAVRNPVRIFLMRGSITENARGFKRHIFRWIERLTAKLCHQTICVAPSLLEFARSERILGPTQGIIVANGMSNGIDSARFDPVAVEGVESISGLAASRDLLGDPKSSVIGFVGFLTRDKGIEELTQAWKSVRGEFPDIHLLLVGPWEKENKCSAGIRSWLEGDPRVHFTGRVDHVVPYYRAMSLFVLPSHREGFPNAPMEAAAMGLPVVATRTVGCVDAVQDSVTGTLVPPRDAKALADAIRRYLKDPELRHRHGEAGRQRVLRDFRQEPIWEALYQEYVRLLQKKGLSVPEPVSPGLAVVCASQQAGSASL